MFFISASIAILDAVGYQYFVKRVPFVAEQGMPFPHCSECVTPSARHKIEILGVLPQ